jgi:D-amino-acid oxidase
MNVVVVGAGVTGLSTSLHLLERFHGAFNLTIVKFSPYTTSDKAGVIMVPKDPEEGHLYAYSADPATEQRMRNWVKATIHRFHSIYNSQANAQVELCLQQGYYILKSTLPDPWYKDEVFGFRHVEPHSVEASLVHTPPHCVDIWTSAAYTLDPTSYLRWLTDRIRQNGGNFKQQKISTFDELLPYDIIINCTGLGSRDLLDDKRIYPLRGQVVKAKAPWVKNWLIYLVMSFLEQMTYSEFLGRSIFRMPYCACHFPY